MCVHKEMIASCTVWCHGPMYLFLLNLCPYNLAVFSISGYSLLPWVSCLALVPSKSNTPLTDNLYNLLGYGSLKNVFKSLVTWYKLDGDGPENYSSRAAEMTVRISPGWTQRRLKCRDWLATQFAVNPLWNNYNSLKIVCVLCSVGGGFVSQCISAWGRFLAGLHLLTVLHSKCHLLILHMHANNRRCVCLRTHAYEKEHIYFRFWCLIWNSNI